jgi:hypothetical protein
MTSDVDMTPRDRHSRSRMRAATPAERLAAMRRLLEASWAMVRRNPAGLAHFRRRNFKARALANGTGRIAHGA